MKRVLSWLLAAMMLLGLAGCGGGKCTSVVLSESNVYLAQAGQTKGLSVTKVPANATDTVEFESSNPTVAVVNKNGLITAVSQGSTTITVTCGDAVAFCEVTVGSSGSNPGTVNPDPVNPDPVNPQATGPVNTGCPDCGGNGSYTCTYCKGNYQCQKCGGSGFADVDWGNETKCQKCGGGPEGNGKCTYCGGKGTKFNRDCASCGGTGICEWCNTNGKMYSYQFGSWAAKCNACNGSGIFCKRCQEGVLQCSTCKGEGYVTGSGTGSK